MMDLNGNMKDPNPDPDPGYDSRNMYIDRDHDDASDRRRRRRTRRRFRRWMLFRWLNKYYLLKNNKKQRGLILSLPYFFIK